MITHLTNRLKWTIKTTPIALNFITDFFTTAPRIKSQAVMEIFSDIDKKQELLDAIVDKLKQEEKGQITSDVNNEPEDHEKSQGIELTIY